MKMCRDASCHLTFWSLLASSIAFILVCVFFFSRAELQQAFQVIVMVAGIADELKAQGVV